MKIKPNKAVYVTATDGKTRKSQGITIYDTTPAQVIEMLRRMVIQQQNEKSAPAA